MEKINWCIKCFQTSPFWLMKNHISHVFGVTVSDFISYFPTAPLSSEMNPKQMVCPWSGLLRSSCLRTAPQALLAPDTLSLCARLSRLHTEVWEAVCHGSSQQQWKSRACDWGTVSLVQAAMLAQRRRRREKRKPEWTKQTDGKEDKQEGEATDKLVSMPDSDTFVFKSW